MAPHGEGSEEAMVVQDENRKPISSILIVIAMQTEAMPVVNKFQLKEDLDPVFPKGVPWVRYHGIYKDLHINLVWPGKDLTLGVDSVGTISASLVTYAAIQALQPDLIINAGTAGGFKVKGACISDVFLVSDVAFHDRRIPIPVFDLYGVGSRQSFSTPNLLKELNLKAGKLSTGDSLDMSPQDEASIVANEATVKDMEQQGELNAKNGEPKASSSISEATTEKQPKEPDQLHSSSSASLSQQSHEPASELEEQPGEPMPSSEINGDINSPRQETVPKESVQLKHGRWKLFQSPQKPSNS